MSAAMAACVAAAFGITASPMPAGATTVPVGLCGDTAGKGG